jgi:hypothetical protein
VLSLAIVVLPLEEELALAGDEASRDSESDSESDSGVEPRRAALAEWAAAIQVER